MGKRRTDRTHRCPPDHRHGETGTCYAHGCGCESCLDGHRDRAVNRRKLVAYGRYVSPRVEARPTLARIDTLRTDGWTWQQIAAASGIAKSSVQRLMRNRPSHVSRTTEASVLAIAQRPAKPARAKVDPIGSRRRLRALARMGWSWTAIAAESSFDVKFISVTAIGDARVMVKTADSIREVYDRLADRTPPKTGSTRARNYAIARGWHAPIEWTGLDMDDPDVEPEPLEADEAGWAVEEAAHLYALGESPTVAAAQLGSEPETLARLARRHGRKDLAVWLGETKRAA